jgi:hypothetical protein
LKYCGLALCLVLAGCGGPTAGTKLAYGPSVTIAVPVDVSGPLVWIVASPIHDKSVTGKVTIDPRTLVALEAPDRATWVVAGRVDAEGGLVLAEAMASTLRSAATTDHLLHVEIGQPLPRASSPGRADVQDGRWRWQGLIEGSPNPRYAMELVDQHGKQLALVEMDAATARDLMRRLSRTIRANPARFTSRTQ